MPTALLTSKLFIPPLRPSLVPRPRLIQLLNAGLYTKRKLVEERLDLESRVTLRAPWYQLGRPAWRGQSEVLMIVTGKLHYRSTCHSD